MGLIRSSEFFYHHLTISSVEVSSPSPAIYTMWVDRHFALSQNCFEAVFFYGLINLLPEFLIHLLQMQLSAATSAVKVLNMVLPDSMPPGSLRMLSKLCRGGSWRSYKPGPFPGVPSAPSLVWQVCPASFPCNLITRWWSVDCSAPLFTHVSTTYSYRVMIC